MLKGIPSILSPDLLKVLMEMGHGNELVIADGNFPSASMAQRLVRCDGIMVPPLLEAIMQFFPLDPYCDLPVAVMAITPGDPYKPVIWDRFREIINKYDKFSDYDYVERNAFYERTKKAYAIIATSESALYANIILKKGVVTES
jgi:L-fucose mutarotase